MNSASLSRSRPKARTRGFVARLRTEYLGQSAALLCASAMVVLAFAMLAFIASKGLASFRGPHPLSLHQFLFTADWRPDLEAPSTQGFFGSLTFTCGSVLVSLLATLLSAPLSVAAAVFMVEISPTLGARYLRPALELFAGIPSVVYGWVGLSVLVPFLRAHFGGLGFSLLAGGLVLSLMILPTITTLTVDALRDASQALKEGSYALGATRWQTIVGVCLPVARRRTGVAITLGLARAFGETLAVQMVIGNALHIPGSLLEPASTLTGIITMDMGNTVAGTRWNDALWSMALLLLLVTFGCILIVRAVGNDRRRAA